MVKSVLVPAPDRRGVIRWDDFVAALPGLDAMDPAPDPQARFTSLEVPLSDARQLAALERDFTDWVFRAGLVLMDFFAMALCGFKVSFPSPQPSPIRWVRRTRALAASSLRRLPE